MSRFGKKNTHAGIVNSFNTRAFRVGGYSVAAAAIVLAIAVMANVLINALPTSMTKIDTTSNQLFSISDQTRQIVSGLDRELSIYWIVSDGGEDATIGSLLEHYEDLNKGITVEKKDPAVYPTFIQQYAPEYTENSLVVVSGERYRYVDYYEIYEYDYEFSYTSYQYTVSGVSFAGESALTSAIDYVVSDNIPKVYILSGHGETALPTSVANAVGKENIDTAELSLLTVEAVPEDADAILVYAPQSDISEGEKAILLTYLQGGGNLYLISGPLQEGSLTNLESLMAEYGVTAQAGVLVEGDQNSYLYGRPYYILPTLGSHAIADPLSEGGYRILLPIAQGLVVADALRDGLTVEQLALSSASSYSKLAGYGLTTYDKEQGDVDGPFSMAVAITEGETQIVWVASPLLLDEQTNTQVSGGNLDFFLNGLNWMCEKDESSISIRSKSLSRTYLSIDSAAMLSMTLLIVGVIPVAYLAVGLVKWVRRRRR